MLCITQLAGQAAVTGDASIFMLVAILSANLAMINLLPCCHPLLYGGALLFYLAASIRGCLVQARL